MAAGTDQKCDEEMARRYILLLLAILRRSRTSWQELMEEAPTGELKVALVIEVDS